MGTTALRSQGQRAGRLNRQGGRLPGPDHRNCGRQDRAPGGSQTGAHPYHPGLAGRVVPPAYGREPPSARRRRRQAGRGRRPPVESRPLDHLYPVAAQGRTGALPAVQAARQPAVHYKLASRFGSNAPYSIVPFWYEGNCEGKNLIWYLSLE